MQHASALGPNLDRQAFRGVTDELLAGYSRNIAKA
jgi:hypothetical protein